MRDASLAKSIFRFSGTVKALTKAFALGGNTVLIRSVTRFSRLYASQT